MRWLHALFVGSKVMKDYSLKLLPEAFLHARHLDWNYFSHGHDAIAEVSTIQKHQITLSAEHVTSVFTRKLPGGGHQVLVCTEQGIQALLGLDDAATAQVATATASICLGSPLRLTEHTPDGGSVPYVCAPGPGGGDGVQRAPLYAVSDPGPVGGGTLCFVSTHDTILRLDPDGVLDLVAGHPGCPGRRDGPGGTAQVQCALAMAPDGTGGLFFSDGSRDCVRRARLALPPPHPAPPPSPPHPALPLPPPPALAVSVATLPFQIPEWSLVHALAYDYTANVLFVCTPRVVYRAVGVGAAAGTAAPGLQPVAGNDEGSGCVDGVGRAALFGSICDAVVDSRGRLYVTDMEGPDGGAVVRRVDPAAGWAVQTLPSASLGDLDRAARLTILHDGWLCAYEWRGNKLWLMQLGLEPSRPSPLAAAPPPPVMAAAPAVAAAAAAAGSDLTGLADDFAALLADPWHIADVTIMVGGTVFHAHSQVLISRCEYFRRRLQQGGRQAHPPSAAAAAGGTGVLPAAAPACGLAATCGRREIPLPDADPDAVAQLLRYLYTGCLNFPEPSLRPILELANRLLLPKLAAQVHQQLLQLRHHHPPAHLPSPLQGAAAAAEVPPRPPGGGDGATAHEPLGAALPPPSTVSPTVSCGGCGLTGAAAPGVMAASQGGRGPDPHVSVATAAPGAVAPPAPMPVAAPPPPPVPPSGRLSLQCPTPSVPPAPARPPSASLSQAASEEDSAPSAPPAEDPDPLQPQPSPQPQPHYHHPLYPYTQLPAEGAGLTALPAFGPPMAAAYGAPPHGPGHMYGGPLPPSTTFGLPPPAPGYGTAQSPPTFFDTLVPPPFRGSAGVAYLPATGVYGAAPPPAATLAPPSSPSAFSPQAYAPQTYGGGGYLPRRAGEDLGSLADPKYYKATSINQTSPH